MLTGNGRVSRFLSGLPTQSAGNVHTSLQVPRVRSSYEATMPLHSLELAQSFFAQRFSNRVKATIAICDSQMV
jgi:hypothetical protein